LITRRTLAAYEVCERAAAELEAQAGPDEDEPNDWAWAALFGCAVGVLYSRFGREAVRAAFESAIGRAETIAARKESDGEA
jgi:hypothetical protein